MRFDTLTVGNLGATNAGSETADATKRVPPKPGATECWRWLTLGRVDGIEDVVVTQT